MKIKLRDLFDAQKVLEKVFNEPMDIKLSYRLAKISKKITSELKDIDEQRIALIKKYADEPTEEEKKINAPQKVTTKIEEFIKEFNALLDSEGDIDIQLIPFNLLLLANIKLSSDELNVIESFIEEDKDAKV